MIMNNNPSIRISNLLKAISQPARLQILLAIGEGEACVCHLEAALGQRQVYISQQLIALRSAGLVADRRDGRFIYYRLADSALLDLVQQAARLAGLSPAELADISPPRILVTCGCPHCLPLPPAGLFKAGELPVSTPAG